MKIFFCFLLIADSDSFDPLATEIFKDTWKAIEIDELIQLSKIKDFEELDVYKY